jgi:hypothetical protein
MRIRLLVVTLTSGNRLRIISTKWLNPPPHSTTSEGELEAHNDLLCPFPTWFRYSPMAAG